MIRYAMEKDIPKIEELLLQVDMVHHNGRPDIFNIGEKYSEDELKELLKNELRPILVSVNEEDDVILLQCVFMKLAGLFLKKLEWNWYCKSEKSIVKWN